MLSRYSEKLGRLSIGLASTSPRRSEMLNKMNLKFSLHSSLYEEDLDREKYSPEDFVKLTALYKVEEVLTREKPNVDILIGADTMVVPNEDPVIEGDAGELVPSASKILGKPNSISEAESMLKRLSGKTHSVLSGVAILVRLPKQDPSERELVLTKISGIEFLSTVDEYDIYKMVFYERTNVWFTTIPDENIRSYVATGEPMDKAGSYGLQGIGGSFVSKIEGCYYNVIGFPLNAFCLRLIEILKLFP